MSATTSQPDRVMVCFGDSIVEQGDAVGHGWIWLLRKKLADGNSKCWRVHNAGVGGNTTAYGLDRYITDVRPYLPAVVLIAFGINDCYVFTHSKISRVSPHEYHRNLHEIIRLVRSEGGQPVLVVAHIMVRYGGHAQGNGQTVEANIQPYNQVMRELGTQMQVPVIDLPARMQAANIDAAMIVDADGVHLSPAGQTIYCELIFNTLGNLHLLQE